MDRRDGSPVGWATCQVESGHPDTCEVTIVVCEDDRIGMGLGLGLGPVGGLPLLVKGHRVALKTTVSILS